MIWHMFTLKPFLKKPCRVRRRDGAIYTLSFSDETTLWSLEPEGAESDGQLYDDLTICDILNAGGFKKV